jgi:hypothetical protein
MMENGLLKAAVYKTCSLLIWPAHLEVEAEEQLVK